MPLSKQQLRNRAKKAAETRRIREKERKNSQRVIKATKTREESEKIDNLAKAIGVTPDRIIHHTGLPDHIVVKSDGKIAFYEVKPKKGSPNKTMLNEKQKQTVKRLLGLGLEVFMIRYEQRGKRPCYDTPQLITVKNLSKHSL